jgi:acyl-CoA thioesterase FadM
VRLRIDRVGNTSITYGWELLKDKEPYVTGSHTIVHVDEQGRPAQLADELRASPDGAT